jgi:UDP:flavonoid glycosyltransferase YjiC (YdhE family)
VLTGSSYRRAAQRIRSEMESLPGPDDVVTLLEELARDKVPVVASR